MNVGDIWHTYHFAKKWTFIYEISHKDSQEENQVAKIGEGCPGSHGFGHILHPMPM